MIDLLRHVAAFVLESIIVAMWTVAYVQCRVPAEKARPLVARETMPKVKYGE